MPVIEVENLTKRFGKVLAVDDVSFAIEPGTITGVLGPNGAGKTTTLRMILDLVRPTEGSVLVLGGRFRDLERPFARVGALVDASGFHPGRSGRNALRVLAAASEIPVARVDEVLELVEIAKAARRPVKGFSLGMRQRLALAAALLGDPEVLVLDEPANGLDPEGVAWLRHFLRERVAEGKTVLVSSHVLSEVEQTVDDILIVSKGRIVAQGSMAELATRVSNDVYVRSPQVEQLAAAVQEAGGRVGLGQGAMRVAGLTGEQIGHLALVNGVELHELREERASLEELFFEVAGTRREWE